MSEQELVSVIVTTYNHADFVEETLRSVVTQTYRNLQIIVNDDGSTDGTQDIIRRFAEQDPRIVPLLSPVNRGVAGNMNQALPLCTGEYVALLAGDDLMLPQRIERQVAAMRANPDWAACDHDLEVFDSASGRTLFRHSEQHVRRTGGIELELSSSFLFGPQAKTLGSSHLIRRRAMPPHGWDPRARELNDWLVGIEVLRHGKRGYIPEVLGRYRRHSRQMSADRPGSAVAGLEEFLIVLGIVAARYPDLAARVKRVRGWLLFRQAVFDWDDPPLRPLRRRQVRVEAGFLVWLWMTVARLIFRYRGILNVTRPIRHAVRRLIGVSRLSPGG